MLRIGEFSKLAKTTIKTLRYYDKVGLLNPAFVDSATQYRYYTEEQLAVMQQILAYREAGLQLEDIARILRGTASSAEEVLTAHKKELCDIMNQLSEQIRKIDSLTTAGSDNVYTATLKEIPPYKVYYCQGYIPTESHIRSFISACTAELRRTNPDVKYSLPDYCCVIYLGEYYRETNIFIEYAQSVDRFGKDTPTLKFKQLEPVTAVSVEHRGSYGKLRDAYLYAVSWAREHGYEILGNARERHINGQWNCEHESEWLTEIQLPVKIN